MEDKLQAELIDIIDESPRVKRFNFRLINVFKFEFEPGQFVIIDFPEIDHQYPYRSYSIASSNKRHKTIEICVSLKEDGCATPLLFKSFIGQRYTMTLPQGRFILPKVLDRDVAFICTGTGIAPFRSMILDIYEKNIPHNNLFLYFGNRTQEDILYREEFETLAEKHDEFHFIPILSQENWSGQKGYVHPYFLEELFYFRYRLHM